jgi:hypothetical protein
MGCCPLHIGLLDSLNNSYGIATLWIGLAFVASLISVRIGLAVALVEILAGSWGATSSDSRPTNGSIFSRASARSC